MPSPADTDADVVMRYHRLSKHTLQAYAPGPGYLDWATQPDPFRRFHGSERLVLPLLADALPTLWADVRRADGVPPRAVDGNGLAQMFEMALGLSAWKEYGGARWSLRCNPSSGNLHPTEAYLICPRLPGIEGGVHHYLSADHALERRAAPIKADEWDASFKDGVLIALTSVHWREAWKYGARAFRYCQHDVGHAIAALRYAAAAQGWRLRLLDDWSDAELATLCGIDREADFPAEAEWEHPDCLLWLGASGPPDAARLLTVLATARWYGVANRLSPGQRAWPEIDTVARASRKPRIESPTPTLPSVLPPLSSAATALRAADLYRQRRSAVAFDGKTGMSGAAFFRMLDALLPRSGIAPWDALPWAPRVHPVFFVHHVDGIAPGMYVLPRHPDAETALRAGMDGDWRWSAVKDCPAHLPLRLLAEADARDAARLICCRQEIAADSAFALGMLVDYTRLVKQGPWHYRQLFWEAGMLGQVLYLEAEAAGLRGTGIGCYFDDEMHRLLGLRDEQFQSFYHFTVGGPVEDSRLASLAPYPSRGVAPAVKD